MSNKEKLLKDFFAYINTSDAIGILAELFDIYARNIHREQDLTENETIKEITSKGYFLLRLAGLISLITPDK